MRLLQDVHSVRSKVRLFGAVTAIAAWAALSLGPGAAGADARGDKLKLGLTRVQQEWLDLGASGPSLGDQFVFIETLHRKGRRDVGAAGGSCMVVGAKPPYEVMTYQCVATLRLPEGQIGLQGLLDATGPDDPQPFTLAITGGTGAYRRASGDAILTLTSYDLRFDSPVKRSAQKKRRR
jgi:hypothetical protein